MTESAMQRHFLFLQGMPCDFFRRVGDALELKGHAVTRINLCFADWLFWHDPRATNYRGHYSGWGAFLREFLTSRQVTDLVLLGEQRKYHKEAVALAQSLNVRVMVTDFGYFRPDWITLEPNGMGEQSTMPRDPDRIKQLAETMKDVDFTPRYRDSSIRMSMGDLVGSLGNVFLRFLYPHYRQSDERPHPLIYFPAMGLSLLRRSFLATAARQQSEAFLLSGQPFFLFPLQLDHDFQIRAYSPFKGLGEAIDHVLDSFFEHAPRDCHLLIKTHPWDPGLDNWKSRIEKRARNAAISGRVHYVEGGSLDEMIAAARGLVTVNSTSGLRALQLNCPVKVLGGAIYDIKGLTAQISLDDFWRAAPQPEYELLTCFINVLVTATQVRGVFFEPYGKALAIDAFTEKVARVD